jgi:hypothetical protein
MSQGSLGDALGFARRTIARWEGGDTNIHLVALQKLALLVHPVDAALAAEIAAETGTTLEGLGIVAAAPPPPPEAAPPRPHVAPPSAGVVAAPAVAPSRSFPPVELTIDSVLYVAVKALRDAGAGEPEAIVQSVLRAAIARARGLGLTLEEVERALVAGSHGS